MKGKRANGSLTKNKKSSETGLFAAVHSARSWLVVDDWPESGHFHAPLRTPARRSSKTTYVGISIARRLLQHLLRTFHQLFQVSLRLAVLALVTARSSRNSQITLTPDPQWFQKVTFCRQNSVSASIPNRFLSLFARFVGD